MKILVIGSGGQVGSKLSEKAAENRDEVYGAYVSRPPTVAVTESFALDKTKQSEVEKAISRIRPDAVIDTGALHNVDYCETHKDEAMLVNETGTRYLAEACRNIGSHFVFVSTDFVFDGVNAPYDENAAPNPLSVYAESKLRGEKAALDANPGKTTIVRPAVIYSWVSNKGDTNASSSGKPLNFAAWLVSQLNAKKELKIVNDQITTPTLADDLASAILALVEKQKKGLYHTAGTTALSRYDFTLRIAEKFKLDPSLVHPIASSELKQAARRPNNSSLISEKIAKEAGYHMMGLDRALEEFYNQSLEENLVASR